MKIDYDTKSGKFLITEVKNDYKTVVGMPDRRFRSVSKVWAAPALRRNIEYIAANMMHAEFSPEAQQVIDEKLAKKTVKAPGFPKWYEFKNPPMSHQQEALDKFYPLDFAAILFEQGLGKTYTAINLTTAWRMSNQIEAAVVICPSAIKLVWEEELAEHCPIPTQREVLESGKYKKAEKFIQNKTDFQWMVVGVEGLSMGGAFEHVKKFVETRKCAIIIDESSRIKTPNKVRTDRCIALGKIAAKRVILSGTSITQGIEDLYSQFKFLDADILGYHSFFSFKAHYCDMVTMEVARDKFVPKIIGYKNEAELARSVAPCTLRVEKKDAVDLPEKVFTNRFVGMNPTQKKIYAEMKTEFFTQVGDSEYEAETVLEQALRLQQITGGHYPHDTGIEIQPRPIPGMNPKLNELMLILDEVTGKVVVWCQFRPEIQLVADALEKAEIQHVAFHGGCSHSEKKEAVSSFRQDPGVKVFLATRAAAYGLTLVEASTAIYYSQGYSLEEYAQSQDRIHRIGQNDPCDYIHLLCDKTIDTKIIKALAAKKNTADFVYNLIKES